MPSPLQEKSRRSRLLSDLENDIVIGLLPPRCESLSTAVVQWLVTDNSQPDQWRIAGCGAACFVQNHAQKTFLIQVYDIERFCLLFEHEIYLEMDYRRCQTVFHMFEADNHMVGLNFADAVESKEFYEIVISKTQSVRKFMAYQEWQQSRTDQNQSFSTDMEDFLTEFYKAHPNWRSTDDWCEYIQGAVCAGQLEEARELIAQSEMSDPESVLDFLCVQSCLSGQFITLLEDVGTKYDQLLRLVFHRIANRIPVYLGSLLERFPPQERRKQLLLTLMELFDDNDDFVAFDAMFHLHIPPTMLQLHLCDILEAVYLDGRNRTPALMNFLEYLVTNGVKDEAVCLDLAHYYVEEGTPDKLLSLLRNCSPELVKHVCMERESCGDFDSALLIYEAHNRREDFIRVSSKAQQFARQLCYLLKQRSEGLWEDALCPTNDNRWRLLEAIDAVPVLNTGRTNPQTAPWPSDIFHQLTLLVHVMARKTPDLQQETQNLIQQLLQVDLWTVQQRKLLELYSLRCILAFRDTMTEGEILQVFGQQLYAYNPLVVVPALAHIGLLEMAKDICLQAGCWKELAQVFSVNKNISREFIREVADKSGDPELLFLAGERCLLEDQIADSLHYFLEAGRFDYYLLPHGIC
ncbi:probable clathrin heavy chain 1 [Paramacrobiotus metropolitanus]|uniref:probable clathrin heavy chain 1 n=1 Tax=Paramacrobiotus metropolitanus TaxID=2943436 RepID=UPI0024457889|nr:probable clathrin heavy chain 1 [Paramacrobiotus metropolitanus]